MANHNANFAAFPLPVGTYNNGDFGNNLTASTIHEVFCLTSGTIAITAMGGGQFTWAATAGQSVRVMCSQIIVSSGSFVGFKTMMSQFIVQQSNTFK